RCSESSRRKHSSPTHCQLSRTYELHYGTKPVAALRDDTDVLVGNETAEVRRRHRGYRTARVDRSPRFRRAAAASRTALCLRRSSASSSSIHAGHRLPVTTGGMPAIPNPNRLATTLGLEPAWSIAADRRPSVLGTHCSVGTAPIVFRGCGRSFPGAVSVAADRDTATCKSWPTMAE